MSLSVIAAMASNRVIGRENRLPWRLPADLARFKALTMGHPLIVGRRTFESIGRPLPGRRMIVVSRRDGYSPDGVAMARTLEAAIALTGGEEAFVAGGADLYRQLLPRADRLYLTVIDRAYEGDAFFPELDPGAWLLHEEERHAEAGGHPGFAFRTYTARALTPQPARS